MRTKHLLLAALSAMTALSACNDEDTFAAQPDAACLQVNATMAGASTRAAIEGTELPQGAQIGVSVFNSDGSNYNGKTDGCLNIPYTRQTGWQTRNPISLSHTVGKAVAYYPYSPEIGDISAVPVETESQTDYLYSDWVNDLTYQNNQADFSMNHALCAIQLNLVNESYEADKGEVTSLAVTSDDLATKGTLNAMTGALSAFSGQGTRIAVNKTFLLSKEVQSTKIIGIPTGHRGLEARRHPDLTVEVTIDGKRNKLTVPMVKAFEQGMAYEVNMKVKDTQNPLELVSVTVKPWVEEILGDVDMYQDNAYIIQVKIPRDGFEFRSNVYGLTGTIDWGDGTVTEHSSERNPSHVFDKAGTYTVIHKGRCPVLNGDAYSKATNSCITDILHIGGNLGITDMGGAFYKAIKLKRLRPGIFDNLKAVTYFGSDYDNAYYYSGCFNGCTNLEYIPEGLFEHCTSVTNFTSTFRNCTALTEIPKGLFDNCTKVTNFWYTFGGCSNITTIPQGLFDKCTAVTNFLCTFSDCSALTAIPNGLFDNCTNVTIFRSTFEGCGALTGIPQGLFDNCTRVTNFENTFQGCSSLTVIPNGLFDNCTNVTNFRSTFSGCSNISNIPTGLFDNCTNVTDFGFTFSGCSSLTTIPTGLFDKCTKVTDFYSTFSGCSSLTTIPQGLFDNCTLVTDFSHTFYRCSSLTTIPLIFGNCPKVTDFSYTFQGCKALTSIPTGLFDNCPNVTGFSETFRGCSSLTTIPAGLFDKCTKVTDFYWTFNRCSALTSIPAGLFDNCPSVTIFGYTFSGCSSLTTIPTGLFDNCTEVTIFQYTFGGCSALTAIPTGLFDNCTEVTSFKDTFSGCSALTTIPTGLFDNCTKVTDFLYTLYECTALTGESPYTLINGQKVHLYERKDYPDHFTAPTSTSYCFQNCTGLTDYAQMPADWK